MRATCAIDVGFPDAMAAEAALRAISHEGDIGNRSVLKLSRKADTLTLEIEADDIVALRATANACLRALQVFEGVEKTEGVLQ
jgi:tRNA threonylcarbamoyladenosine modification (KEOPS) complex  Pcc1 subunit